jgi:hypothetical protein
VKFSVAQAVAVPPAQLMAAYGSVDFYEGRPTGDDIVVLGVVDHEVGPAGTVVVEVHYAFRGSVSPAVRRVVDPAKMSWITRTEIHPDEERGRGRATWAVMPDYYPDRLTSAGVFRFDPTTSSTTSVTVEGDLKVHVPIVGRSVERVIVAGLRRYLQAELVSIPDFVTRSG